MSGRGGVRSSARLSGDAVAATTTAAAAVPAAPGPTVRVALGRGRPVATTAAAALRRARAAERAREVEDSPRVLREKCRRLARALRNAKHLVVYTGAGISTAADIPDYRGPDGVWTRLQRGETVGRVEVSRARPTFTHMALTALWAKGALKFVVSQNCDGLHLRSGLPRRALAELHGDMFAELCTPCRRVYLRAFDTTERTARHQHGTRRLCHACGTELRDSIVHFGERGRAAWPLNWAGALRHAARADVVLCLGSSLKVLRRYPRLWRMQSAPRARPALYIVNLQWTPKDSVAALKINARCDVVMQQVARRLRLRVPRYRAGRDPVLAHAEPLAAAENHTTRRPLLRAPAELEDSASDEWEPSSPSASDSDEEVPLNRLADRLRGPSPEHLSRPAPDRLGGPTPDRLNGPVPDRFFGNHPNHLRGPPPDRFRGLPPDRCRGLPPDRLRGPLPDHLRGFHSNRMRGLPPGIPPDRLQGPSPDRLRGPPLDRLRGPPPDRMRRPRLEMRGIPPERLRVRHPDQMRRLPSDRFHGPYPERPRGLPPEYLRKVPPEKLRAVPLNAIRGSTPNPLPGSLAPDRLSDLPVSDRIPGVPASDELPCMPPSDRLPGPPASDQSLGLRATDRLPRLAVSEQPPGLLASDQLTGLPASDRLPDLPSADQLPGLPADNQSKSEPELKRTLAPDSMNESTSNSPSLEVNCLSRVATNQNCVRSPQVHCKPEPNLQVAPIVDGPCQSTPDSLRGPSLDRPHSPVSDRLRAFQVSLQSGEVTILLRAEHVPSPEPTGINSPRCRTTDLRRFRMARHVASSRTPDHQKRPLTINGHSTAPDDTRTSPNSLPDDAKLSPINGAAGRGSRLRRLLEYEPRIDASENAKRLSADCVPKSEFELDVKAEVKVESKVDAKIKLKKEGELKREYSSDEERGALAAAIIRRTVLLCRGSLYPGLHTIIAPSTPAPRPASAGGLAGAECAWCARHYSARRCLWYGPPRDPPPNARTWRRVRGRRYLCACCGAGESPPRQPESGPDEGGWYGKGYRKGRRRRR